MNKYQYKIVRSYTDGCTAKSGELSRLFSEGYEFVRASEVVENSSGKCNYIEYIVRKEVDNGWYDKRTSDRGI